MRKSRSPPSLTAWKNRSQIRSNWVICELDLDMTKKHLHAEDEVFPLKPFEVI